MNHAGIIERHEKFESRFVAARQVDVWVPPNYEDNEARYSVLYMHDGQNLFESANAYGGISWEIDRAMLRLISAGKTRGSIVVGVWSSETRWRDYMPQKPYESPEFNKHRRAFLNQAGGEPISDLYLKFLIQELKPFIDSHYRTLPDQKNTFVMGSSMGGLISLYAISEYPDVFSGAGCVSTHWSIGGYELVHDMALNLPDPSTHKLYFDFGTRTLDSGYEPFQRKMDEHIRKAGYIEEQNWITHKFEGAEHSERSWRERVDIPLEFLLI